ncbi:unnamed protein product, partial [Dibothriocephalus latus]
MDAFLGTWKFKDGDDIDALVQRMGVKIPKNQLDEICNCIPTVARDGDGYSIHVEFGPKTWHIKFKLGQEFDTTSLDGRQVKLLFSMDGKVFKIRETGDKVVNDEWTVEGNILSVAMKVDDVTCVRRFIKVGGGSGGGGGGDGGGGGGGGG